MHPILIGFPLVDFSHTHIPWEYFSRSLGPRLALHFCQRVTGQENPKLFDDIFTVPKIIASTKSIEKLNVALKFSFPPMTWILFLPFGFLRIEYETLSKI